MSYDLISYIKHEETVDLEREIVAFFKKYGFDIELHPEFDLLKSSGFTPILFKKTSEFWTRIPNKPECDLVAGPELYVDPFHEERPQKCGIFHKLFSIFKKEEELSPLAEMNFSIVSASPRYITLDGLASFIFSAAICSIYKGILINFQGFYNVKSERLDEYLNAVFEDFINNGIDLKTAIPFKDWYDGTINENEVKLCCIEGEEESIVDYKLIGDKRSNLNEVYPPSRLQAIFEKIPESFTKFYCVVRLATENKKPKNILVAERGNRHSKVGMFTVSLPIKKVEITNQNRIITAEGMYNGKSVGFVFKIPLNAEALIKDVDNKPASDKFTHRPYDAYVISSEEKTLNLFNMLGIGNFKRIKSSVKFIFNKLVGNIEDINENCENTEEETFIKYSTLPYGRQMKDNDVRTKIATYYDDDPEHQLINGEEDSQELEFLIDISPSEKRVYFIEKDTTNRYNLKYTFIDRDK